ncbi:MAG: SRPBCC family protein [Steroidobacteraceae bacterium]
MRFRMHRWLVALGALGLSVMGSQAMAADYATIVLSTNVDRPADAVWKKIGGFCDLGAVLKMSCTYTSGSGGLGTVRLLAGRIEEVMVAKTAHSYTYTQPDTKILYHGTVDVEPAGRGKSRILYSLFYDQSDLKTEADKTKARDQRTKVFTRALDSMKKLAEGG